MNIEDKAGIGFMGLMVLAFFGLIGAIGYNGYEDHVRRAAYQRTALFRTGDIVQTKIGHFRGIVTDRWCYDGCTYSVRFPTASMHIQEMGEYELEHAR